MTTEPEKNSASRFNNRELSWLEFNNRVLDEAFNSAHPLLERLHFLAISAANLDEFYMVRIGGLYGQIYSQVDILSDDGLTAEQQLEKINIKTAKMMERQQKAWQEIRKELEGAGIHVCRTSELIKSDIAWLRDFFQNMILPLLTPIAIDPAHPFPLIPNKGIALILEMQENATGEIMRHLIAIPSSVERFVLLNNKDADDPGKKRFIQIERVVLLFAEELLPGFTLKSSGVFRVIRNSEIEFDDRAEDLLRTYEHTIKKRRMGHVIRLGIHSDTSESLRGILRTQIRVDEKYVHSVRGINGLSDLREIVNCGRNDLRYPPYAARHSERIIDFKGDIFAAISKKDLIIHHPYESFDAVVVFLLQAAKDPAVVAIKQTLYRTSAHSPIVQALIEAASAGKAVTVMIELKARFDEEANITISRALEGAGAQVVYGFTDLKTHAKLSMVVRREQSELKSYTHIGTGNYHPQTAKVYTDLSLFTANAAIGRDVAAMFNYMTGYAEPRAMEKIAFAPITLRQKLYELIDAEIAHAKNGKPASIWAKLNSLVDPDMIDKLYEASSAGVEIMLVVRGICCLKPNVPGLSDRITVRSIVGRFLEHSRIVCFGNGEALPGTHANVFITSADWMQRNLDRRIEIMAPIENSTVHEQVLNQIMVANIKDNTQSWEMDMNGSYRRITPAVGEEAFSAHEYFMKNPSLSGRGSAMLEGIKPPDLKLRDV
ncbi:MAG: RNA degradosome polyphosphate kinase [Alphaproteobacteria bacterium]|nr:RNA degradosome polyphosphate kinase [Alphaproteobacteria bacterium]